MGFNINAKSIRIPQGVVKQISANGSIIWKAPEQEDPDEPIYSNE